MLPQTANALYSGGIDECIFTVTLSLKSTYHTYARVATIISDSSELYPNGALSSEMM